jgi:hypothetical protein
MAKPQTPEPAQSPAPLPGQSEHKLQSLKAALQHFQNGTKMHCVDKSLALVMIFALKEKREARCLRQLAAQAS